MVKKLYENNIISIIAYSTATQNEQHGAIFLLNEY